jgi:hypothetical protein
MSEMNQTGQNTYETKWGHVAYGYEDYLKLKRLHKIWFKAVRAAARWERWVRKAPHNRLERRTLRDAAGRKIGREVVGPAPEPRVCDLFSRKLVTSDREPVGRWFVGWVRTDDAVAREYRKARYPKPASDDVEPAAMSGREIDAMLADAEGWLGGS